MDKLSAGIIGLGDSGVKLLGELNRNNNYRIKAVADRDKELAQNYGQQYDAVWYDDYRLAIVQEKLDVLFLMQPTYLCAECIALAAKKGVHVFKGAPLGRTLPEASQWIRQMEKAGKFFHVGARKRFSPGYLYCHQLLQEKRIGSIYLLQAEGVVNFQGEFDWRGDPVLSGGGVLLEMAYRLIDQITWNTGTPEKLYSLNTNFCSKRALPPYRTEDTAVVTMKFPDGAIGNLVCSWMSGNSEERFIVYGTEGKILAGENVLRLCDSAGNTIQEEHFKTDESWQISQEVRHFAGCIFDDKIKPVSTARQHLANVAIIETAYLSGRTQLPESVDVYGDVFEIE